MWGVTVSTHVVDVPALSTSAGGGDAISARATVGPSTGFRALEQHLLSCASGRSSPRTTGQAEEVLFVIAGTGVLHLAGVAYQLERESGAYLAPGESYEIENRGADTLELVAVRIPPDPLSGAGPADGAARAVVRRLADQQAEAATAAREFRIVADPETGLSSATQFVGYIPSGRAPDHFHTYDEVIYVLEGEGALHAQGVETPVAAGSCIQLPARVVHCLENKGGEVMRVVAVFRPAGSPAAAYYPDGTPASPEAPSLEAS
jgi:mannose-6-phosphate isomerase-like protein (cupin superfamily)